MELIEKYQQNLYTVKNNNKDDEEDEKEEEKSDDEEMKDEGTSFYCFLWILLIGLFAVANFLKRKITNVAYGDSEYEHIMQVTK